MNQQTLKGLLNKYPQFIKGFSRQSHMFFALCYFPHLFPIDPGILQMNLFQGVSVAIRHAMYPSFPDSYTSNILLYTHVLWRIFGVSQYTHCAIVCGNRETAQEVYKKLVQELLENPYLKIFNHGFKKAHGDGWNITIPNYQARISVLVYPTPPSKVMFHRRPPDMVIGIDLENEFVSVASLTKWVAEEFYNPKHLYESTIVLGTCTRKRNIFESVYEEVRSGKLPAVFISPVPLFDENKKCFWVEQYSQEEINNLLKNYSDTTWQLKYLCHTRECVRVSKECFSSDGTINEDKVKEQNTLNNTSFSIELYQLYQKKKHSPWKFDLIPGREYYGVGTVIEFIKK